MTQLLVRFLIGGAMVSSFAVSGDILKPKTLAGLFGAAPSVALATLALTVLTNGQSYAGKEARSMIAGAFALLLFGFLSCRLMVKYRWHAAPMP